MNNNLTITQESILQYTEFNNSLTSEILLVTPILLERESAI